MTDRNCCLKEVSVRNGHLFHSPGRLSGGLALNHRLFSPTPRFDREPFLKSVRIGEEHQVPVGIFDDRDAIPIRYLMLRLYQLV
jgi:hypothetical protein